MKNRHFVVFAIILAGLIAVYVMQLRASRVTKMETGYVSLYPDLKTDEVMQIKAYRSAEPDKGLVLVKEAGGWVVRNKFDVEAKQDQVTTLLKDLKDLKGEPRSDTADKLATFDLTDADAVHIELLDKDNKKLADLLFGKKGFTGETTFVRKAGENKVYSGQVRLNTLFQVWSPQEPIGVLRWCELRLKPMKDWRVVNRAELYLPNGLTAVFEKKPDEKGQGQWAMTEPAGQTAMDSNQALNAMAGLANLIGEDVLDPAAQKEYGLDKAPYRAVLFLNEVNNYEILLAPYKDQQYVAMIRGGKTVYLISQPNFERSFGKVEKQLTKKSEPEKKPES